MMRLIRESPPDERPIGIRMALCVGLLVAACGEFTNPMGRHMSFIGADGPSDEVGIPLPDTVYALPEETIPVPFYTFGSSSCTVPAGEDVTVDGRTISITPYDRDTPSGTPCTADLARFRRWVLAPVPTGQVTFQLRGQGESPPSTITLTRTVTIVRQPPN